MNDGSIYPYEAYCDELGPSKIVHIYDPQTRLKAIVVVDNTACGPAIGGTRMATDVSTEEVLRLARAMSLKNAAAGLPHGGAKSGILADPRSPDKTRLVRAFARAIRDLVEYIPGPDMGTDESSMAQIYDEIGRAVGLPKVLGGIPLDEIGATGYGVARCAEVCAPLCKLPLDGATLAVEGFGNVGYHAARFLAELGVRLVAASDSRGGIYNPDGIPVADLHAVKTEQASVTAYSRGERISRERLFELPCDILVPAARPDSIHEGNVARVQARLILQGANIPATAGAEAALHERGVLVVPDFIANAGGVICGSVEYHGGTETAALEAVASKIRINTEEVLERSRKRGVLPREAAVEMARERIEEARALKAG